MKREIITLCGSTRFYDQFREVEKKLTMEGKIPLPPAFYGKAEGLEYSSDVGEHLWKLHLDKINISDGIYVVNPGGYIGESTQKEINHAREKGKTIRFYSEEMEKNKNIS